MKVDYQNLDEGATRRYWSHGRIWLRRRGEGWNRRCDTLHLEWCAPHATCRYGVTFGGGDAGRDLGCSFSIPWLITFYVTLDNVFPMYAFGTDFDRGHDRVIEIYFSDWAVWYHVWVGSMASWSRDYPWCRWWRQGSLHFANLLGKQRHTLEVLKEGIPLAIPMPEGVYHAVATIERRTWKRRCWFARQRTYVDVKVPKGIPFAGKGENSWDCGDDGLFGYGVEGTSLEKAIAHGVEVVLTNRRRYGAPSPQAIVKALKV